MNLSIIGLRYRWQQLIGGMVLALGCIACLLLLSQRHDFQGSCVPPRDVDALGPRIYDNHQTINVSRGSVVTVQLVTGASEVWPWGTPRSSDETVLRPVPLCFDPTNVSSLPVQLTPFKAVAPGKALITADAVNSDAERAFVLQVTVNP